MGFEIKIHVVHACAYERNILDSECDWLLLIQTATSYKLNPMIPRRFTAHVETMNVTAAKSESRIIEETAKLGDLLPKVIDEMVMQVFSLPEVAEEKVQLLKYESMQSLTESVYAEES